MSEKIFDGIFGGVKCEYDEEGHMYYQDGVRTKGVTTVLGVINKPALIYWAANTALKYVSDNIVLTDGKILIGGLEATEQNFKSIFKAAKEAPDAERDEAADIGKLSHSYFECYLKGERDFEIDDRCAKPWTAFLKWVEKYKPEPIQIEKRVYCISRKYAGCFDLLCDLNINGSKTRYIIDFKTSKRIYPDSMIPQLGAYNYALAEMEDKLMVPGIANVHLPKDNENPGWYDFSSKLDPGIKFFLACLEIYNLQSQLKKSK